VHNGSSLFTGDAGQGESNIRRWIIENDWLEAIVALPLNMFYNTGIATYIWVLSNRKTPSRKGKAQLINAMDFWVPMRKSLGDKRREISAEHIAQITQLYLDFQETETCKLFATTDFGYRKVTVERPLRLNFQANPERIARLDEQTAFTNLAKSTKRSPEERLAQEAAGRQQQAAIRRLLTSIPDTLFKDREQFEHALDQAIRTAGPLEALPKITGALRKAMLSAISERDESAEICRDKDGFPEPDPELRDYENIPLKEDIRAYFEREVRPHVPDAWIDEATRDHKDGEIGKVGYEINFNRYFYKYQPPRPLKEIETDIKQIEKEIMDLLREVTE
jgi:type I restriction enzyme M protein